MKSKMLIGEVAKRFNISKQTLIYNNKIGLLKPYYSEPNSYRYYTYEDIDKLELILTLKESGLNHNTIKNYLV